MHCFISYRRDDTEGYAGWLADILRTPTQGRAKAVVFLDVDDIAPGENFVHDMVRAVRESDVVLVLIGPRWMRPALQDANDAVRLELEAALLHRVPMHVVLMEGASRPSPESLPESLRGLASAPSHRLAEADFEPQVSRLVSDLGRQVVPKERSTRPALAELLVEFANAGFWTSTDTVPIRLDGNVLGEFALGGGRGRFDIPPGRHRISAGKWKLFGRPTVEFDVAAGESVTLVIRWSPPREMTYTIERR